jgi:tRNA (pseudouridine54-N1)-methyltransferase
VARSFVVVGHEAASGPDFTVKDLPVWRTSTPGVDVAQRGLADLEDELEGNPVLLEEGAPDAAEEGFPADPILVLSDHQDLTEEERGIVGDWGAEARGLGDQAYHADQAVTVASWLLDRDGR